MGRVGDYFSPIRFVTVLIVICSLVFFVSWRFLGLDSTFSWASDLVPLAFAVVGIVVSIRKLREDRQAAVIALIVVVGLCGTGILHIARARAEERMESVRKQNEQILHDLQKPPLSPEAAEIERKQNILKALRGEYILSHSNIAVGVLEGVESPPPLVDWMNKRLGELGETWAVTGVTASTFAPRSPGAAIVRLGEGSDKYKEISSKQVGEWAIAKSEEVADLVSRYQDRMDDAVANKPYTQTPGQVQFLFTTDFKECCLQPVMELRDEILRRLGPLYSDAKEEQQFAEIKKFPIGGMLSPWAVGRYAPYLRGLGVRCQRMQVPRQKPQIIALIDTSQTTQRGHIRI